MKKEANIHKLVTIAILSIFIITAFVVIGNSITIIKDIPLSKFEPFQNNKKLVDISYSNKIENNLPEMEGASAFYPLAANIVQAVYSKEAYTEDVLKMVSTSKAYEDLLSGNTDCIVATYPSNEQMSEEEKDNVEFVFLYREPLVVYVNIKNKIKNISIEDMINAYLYQTEFNTYTLPKGNGSRNCIEKIVDTSLLDSKHKEVESMQEIIDSVGEDRAGIAYAFSSYYNNMHINKNTKIIDVEELSYTSYDYPLQFDVYLMYKKDNYNKNIMNIVEFIQSEEGKELINSIKNNNAQTK